MSQKSLLKALIKDTSLPVRILTVNGLHWTEEAFKQKNHNPVICNQTNYLLIQDQVGVFLYILNSVSFNDSSTVSLICQNETLEFHVVAEMDKPVLFLQVLFDLILPQTLPHVSWSDVHATHG